MEKNYSISQKNRVNIKHLLITVFLTLSTFLISSTSSAQNYKCTVNANDLELQGCVGTEILIGNGSSGTSAEFHWTQLSGPSVVINELNPTVNARARIIGAVAGTYEFVLKGTCDASAGGFSAEQVVVLTVFDRTQADAGSDIEACPGTYNLSANTPGFTGESGVWSLNSGDASAATITDPTDPNSEVVFSPSASGTVSYDWVITGTNPNPVGTDFGSDTTCENLDTVTLTNYGGEVIVNAGVDPVISNCFTSTSSTTLSGSSGGIGLGSQTSEWTFVSGPTSPSELPVSNLTDISVTGLVEGVYVFRYSVSGPCASGEDTVTVVVPPATQDISGASVVSPLSFCVGVTEAVLEGSAPLFTGETVEWVQLSGATATINSPNSPTTTVSGLSGNSTFGYKIKGGPINPDCESNLAVVTIGYYLIEPTIVLDGGNDIVVLSQNKTEGSVPFTQSGDGNTYSFETVAGPTLVNAPGLSISGNRFYFDELLISGTYTFKVTR
jgi:hypothetical protein